MDALLELINHRVERAREAGEIRIRTVDGKSRCEITASDGDRSVGDLCQRSHRSPRGGQAEQCAEQRRGSAGGREGHEENLERVLERRQVVDQVVLGVHRRDRDADAQ